jgi:hypothetical protein
VVVARICTTPEAAPGGAGPSEGQLPRPLVRGPSDLIEDRDDHRDRPDDGGTIRRLRHGLRAQRQTDRPVEDAATDRGQAGAAIGARELHTHAATDGRCGREALVGGRNIAFSPDFELGAVTASRAGNHDPLETQHVAVGNALHRRRAAAVTR